MSVIPLQLTLMCQDRYILCNDVIIVLYVVLFEEKTTMVILWDTFVYVCGEIFVDPHENIM